MFVQKKKKFSVILISFLRYTGPAVMVRRRAEGGFERDWGGDDGKATEDAAKREKYWAK